ncbi:MAG: hypothetical protein RI894_1884 [Bacteroidota bacterium]
MKNILLLLFITLLINSTVFAQADVKIKNAALPVVTKIAQVTVFLQGAQVQRKGSAMLEKGRNEFVFKALSPYLDAESIRLRGDGTDFTVLSVNYATNFIDEQQKRGDVEALEIYAKSLQQKIDLENINTIVWQQEISSLAKNDLVFSSQSGVKTAELKELMEYRTARLHETNVKIYESNQKISEWRSEKGKVEQQMAAINAKSSTQTGEITIVVNAETGGTVNFDLSYSAAKASWLMSYDLRIKDVASPMNLLYKANVQQQTGEDWKDVKLVFSTGNPSYNHAPPRVNPWYLREAIYNSTGEERGFSTEESGKGYATRWVKKRGDGNCLSQNPDDCFVWVLETIPSVDKTETEQVLVKPASKRVVDIPAEYATITEQVTVADRKYETKTKRVVKTPAATREIEIPAEYKTVTKQPSSAVQTHKEYDKKIEDGEKSKLEMRITHNITNTLYEVGLPYTVLNDGKTYTAEIKTINVPASYQYYTAPKLSTDAYLTALVTNWDELQLIQGEAALYYEGTYTGKTSLNPDNTNDTLRISLGIDKGIVVQRTKLKEYAKKQFWGDKQSEERAYEIAIRNRKALPITIIIDDQFPLSPQKDISVENIDFKDAKLDERTGKLTWKQVIESAQERKFVLHYKVKYPKNKVILVD